LQPPDRGSPRRHPHRCQPPPRPRLRSPLPAAPPLRLRAVSDQHTTLRETNRGRIVLLTAPPVQSPESLAPKEFPWPPQPRRPPLPLRKTPSTSSRQRRGRDETGASSQVLHFYADQHISAVRDSLDGTIPRIGFPTSHLRTLDPRSNKKYD